MDKLKLLTITVDSNGGGSSKSLINLLQELKKYNILPKVILPSPGYLSEALTQCEIEFEFNKYLRLSIWPPINGISDILLFVPRLIRHLYRTYQAKKKLQNSIINFSPNIIHSNSSLISYGFDIAKSLRIPHIWHIREYGDKDFNVFYYPTKSARLNKLKQSFSICITENIKKEYNLKTNCEVIYNGIKRADQIILESKKEKFFLYVGRLTENKGVTDLIKAYILYRKHNGSYDLCLVGRCEKSYFDYLFNLMDMEGVTNYVHFLGEHTDVDKYMATAKATIIPSKHEAFGRVLAEALFNGSLIIGRYTDGLKEQFDLGRKYSNKPIGLIFMSINELADQLTIAEQLSFKELSEYVNAGQYTVSKLYTIEQCASKFRQVLLRLSGN